MSNKKDMIESSKKTLGLVLCTCNSSKYVGEQLDSILNQTLLPDQLIVYDDCSEDDTINIINKRLKDSPFECIINQNENRLGFVKNFEKAIANTQTDYIALCDHDDVWLPNKNEELFKALIKIEDKYGVSTPALSFCDSSLVDEDLLMMEKSFIKSTHVDPLKMFANQYSLSMQNVVTGMCCMLNSELKRVALPIPENVAVHDWWIALIAHRFGKISFVDEPLVLYRQHSSNCLGSGSDIGLNWMKVLRNKIIHFKFRFGGIKRLKDHAIMYRNSYLIRVPHLIELYKVSDDYNYIIFAELIEQGGFKRLFHALKNQAAPIPIKAKVYFFMMFSIFTLYQKYKGKLSKSIN